MKLYIDTPALLRVVLRESGALEALRSGGGLVSSELIAVEGTRTIDRFRLRGSLSMSEAAARLAVLSKWLDAIDLVLLLSPGQSRSWGSGPGSLPRTAKATGTVLATRRCPGSRPGVPLSA